MYLLMITINKVLKPIYHHPSQLSSTFKIKINNKLERYININNIFFLLLKAKFLQEKTNDHEGREGGREVDERWPGCQVKLKSIPPEHNCEHNYHSSLPPLPLPFPPSLLPLPPPSPLPSPLSLLPSPPLLTQATFPSVPQV